VRKAGGWGGTAGALRRLGPHLFTPVLSYIRKHDVAAVSCVYDRKSDSSNQRLTTLPTIDAMIQSMLHTADKDSMMAGTQAALLLAMAIADATCIWHCNKGE
jgi:hypothetical protein